jgi:hypothetical protein
MQHHTILSDLDHTRERAQLMESENEHLRAELMRQQRETERALKQVIQQMSSTNARVCVFVQTDPMTSAQGYDHAAPSVHVLAPSHAPHWRLGSESCAGIGKMPGTNLLDFGAGGRQRAAMRGRKGAAYGSGDTAPGSATSKH